MLISLTAAAAYFDTTERDLYANYKYNIFIRRAKFDIDSYNEALEKKQEEDDFKIDMVNFAEFVISKIGELNFYAKIPTLKRQQVKRCIENSKFTIQIANLVKDTFIQWIKSYENIEEVTPSYIPLEDRAPLTANWIMSRYWSSQKTTLEMAQELNVPEGWVQSEIKRLGLLKKDNGIIRKSGMKGKILTKEQRKKHENQPHAKAIVCICPKTFQIVAKYSSQGAVERCGFCRENVRKAIKRCGLSGGYLWAFEGLEQPTIKIAKRKGNLKRKLQVHNYKPPSKKELELHYIHLDKSATKCAEFFKCHSGTISVLASKYGLRKRTEKVSTAELKRLYIEEGLQAKQIAKICGHTTATISTYLSRSGIRKDKLKC